MPAADLLLHDIVYIFLTALLNNLLQDLSVFHGQ